jgi:hypothetical protein
VFVFICGAVRFYARERKKSADDAAKLMLHVCHCERALVGWNITRLRHFSRLAMTEMT